MTNIIVAVTHSGGGADTRSSWWGSQAVHSSRNRSYHESPQSPETRTVDTGGQPLCLSVCLSVCLAPAILLCFQL